MTSDGSPVRRINAFFKTALKRDIKGVEEQLDVTELQAEILRMRYVEKRSIPFIADTIGYSRQKVDAELATLRKMLEKII